MRYAWGWVCPKMEHLPSIYGHSSREDELWEHAIFRGKVNQPVSSWKERRNVRHSMAPWSFWSSNHLLIREPQKKAFRWSAASTSVHCGRTCALALLAQLSLPTSWQLPQRHGHSRVGTQLLLLELGELSAVSNGWFHYLQLSAFSVGQNQTAQEWSCWHAEKGNLVIFWKDLQLGTSNQKQLLSHAAMWPHCMLHPETHELSVTWGYSTLLWTSLKNWTWYWPRLKFRT